ncbi:MAG: asparagine synthase (glutamine-hydrolyzing), partial [Anaerolineaceae bacterium]|nr:asparagine synthase (glutamine-hydrolyzing) [Anaerolineaceae bacterium]
QSLAHRGPDEQSTWIDPDRPHCGLAHARLAILDRQGGRQPMSDPAHPGRCVVFNGEIYNHARLRRDLESRGHRFASDHSDTEVLLPLYDEYGQGMMEHLRGMFAFALYDGPGGRLLLSRDRMGQKPLYWTVTDRCLAFASELKTLLLAPGVSTEVDLEALQLYLALGYVPSPLTIYRGLYKLPPATRMSVPLDPVPDDPRPTVYWSLPHPAAAAASASSAAAGEVEASIGESLAEAVALRLESDVPLGFFLSGGLDSSLVLALARRTFPDRPLKAFSMTFPEARYDESPWAALVAKHVGAEHVPLEIQPASIGELLPEMVRSFDEPFADSSAVATWLLARATREQVTVAVSGDGGDELFGGYDRYRAVRLAATLDGGGPLKNLLSLTARLVPRGLDLKSRRSRLRRFTDALPRKPLERYARWVSPFHESSPRRLYSAKFRDNVAAAEVDYLREHLPESLALEQAVMRLDAATYLPEDVLTKVDRTSMAHGLEVRSPLLDHKLVELAMGLSARRKLDGGAFGLCRKRLLRRVAADLLPPEILGRSKMGFGVPVSAWLAGPQAQWMGDKLTGGPLAESGLLDREVLRRYIDQHTCRRSDHGPRLYSLLVLDEFLTGGAGQLKL